MFTRATKKRTTTKTTAKAGALLVCTVDRSN
jgi:hypothetical protein